MSATVCENCERREAVAVCPCGCERRTCHRCTKSVRRALLGRAVALPENSPLRMYPPELRTAWSLRDSPVLGRVEVSQTHQAGDTK